MTSLSRKIAAALAAVILICLVAHHLNKKATVSMQAKLEATSESSHAPAESATPPVAAAASPLPAATATPKQKSSSKEFSLETFKKTFAGNWELLRLPDGRVQSLSGGSQRLESLDRDAATQLARKMAGHFGVPAEQLEPSTAAETKTRSRIAYRFDQTLEGIPVFQGGMALFAVLPHGDVTLVNNDLFQIDRKEPGPTLSGEKAAREFETADADHSTVKSVGKVVYYVENRTAIPAYVAVVKRPGEPIEDQVVIEGNTGRVLHRQPLGMY